MVREAQSSRVERAVVLQDPLAVMRRYCLSFVCLGPIDLAG